jgi:hypothetical protein
MLALERMHGVVAAAVLAGVGCGDSDRTPATSIESIQLTRHGALGFCIEDGQFLTAEIAAGPSGVPALSGTMHRGWEDPVLTGCEGVGCERLQDVGPVQLSAAQRARLEELIDPLPQGGCLGAVDPACDPCLVSNLIVNGSTFRIDPCAAGCSDSLDLAQRVADSIDSLVR